RDGLDQPQGGGERRAGVRVDAQADAGGLAQAQARELPDRLVGERAAAADDADRAGLVDVTRHDADLALTRGDDAGTVGADQATRLLPEEAHGAGHVQDRDALGNGDDDLDARVGGLHDGVGGARRRDEDHGGVGAGLADRLGDGVEDRHRALVLALPGSAALARGDTADHLRAVRQALLGVEAAGLAQALTEDARVFIYEDAHRSGPSSLSRSSDRVTQDPNNGQTEQDAH